MAIGYARFTFVGSRSGGSAVAAAAYRHRAAMTDRRLNKPVSFTHKARDLDHEEISLPPDAPEWMRALVEGGSIAKASEELWNAAQGAEVRADAQLARELLLALPVELSLDQNIALVREFVETHLTSKGMVADWVIHGTKDNPHLHLMHTIRPLTPEGFGPKVSPVLGEDGKPLRVATTARPEGQIVYQPFVGERSVDRAWKLGWAETANRHLALAGHDIQIDMRSYVERGLDIKPQRHLGTTLAALVREGKATHFAPAREAERQQTADRLAADPSQLITLISDQQSTFTEQDIARALHRHVDDIAVFQNIKAAVLQSPELCLLRPAVPADKSIGRTAEPAIYTTREMMKVEHGMAEAADRLAAVRRFGVSEKVVMKAVRVVETKDASCPFRFDEEQVEAVRHVTGNSAIAAVVGYAGAGKSTLLEAARVAWADEGRRVFGAALSGKAAEGLQESSGIVSRTLASWELAWKNGNAPLQKGDVFVIDEAGMVSSRQLARFVTAVEEAGAKLVLVGDAQQLQPIQAGAAFRAIIDRIGAKHLVGVRRQREDWMQEASRNFASGNAGKFGQALAAYNEHGAVRQVDTQDTARAALVADWTQRWAEVKAQKEAKGEALRGDELIVLAHTNANVRALNDSLRGVLQQAGELSEARSFTTQSGTLEFAAGDRLLFLENASFTEPTALRLERQSVKNGMLGTVIATTDEAGNPRLTVRLDAGREVTFTTDTYRNIDHGYATTIHKSQGATVDHTFVLASSMMDQHLTYVAMSRHRHSVTMYAAQDEFSNPRAGRLVAHGPASYEHEPSNKMSYFVTLENDKGVRNTVWGVDLERALTASGAEAGAKIELQHMGSQPVTLPDGTLTHRNEWQVRDAASVTFEQIERQLSRSGAKTTTLDFENEPLYRDHANAFLERRGFEVLRDIGPALAAVVEKQAARLAQHREALADLWSRAEHAFQRIGLSRAADAAPAIAADTHKITTEDRIGPERPALIAGVREHAEPLVDAARARFLQSAEARDNDAELTARLARIYRNLEGARQAITGAALRLQGDTARLSEQVVQRPQSFGGLRGSSRLIDGRTARSQREEAMLAVPEVATLARMQAIAWRNTETRHVAAEERRREAMSVAIPALTQSAARQLDTLRSLRQQGGDEAWRKGVDMLRQDAGLRSEIRAVNNALNARYGFAAFTDKADELAARTIEERTRAEGRKALAEEAPRLSEVRAVSAALQLAEKREQAQAAKVDQVPAAPAVIATPAEKPAPMFAAVTSFSESVEQVATRRAWARPHVEKDLAELAAEARKVWTDPARAVATIRARVEAGTGAQLRQEISQTPEAFGELRGSGRMLDRFSAAGAERKAALEAVAHVGAVAFAVQSNLANYRAQEVKAETENRSRMAIEVPGFTPAAQSAIEQVRGATDSKARQQVVAGMSLEVRAEIAQVDKALRARFGNYTGARDHELAHRIPTEQQGRLAATRPMMVATGAAVTAGHNLQHEQERLQRGQTRGITPSM
ncbi:plasmid mobilization system relaxase [Ancylobacter aquaticus]|uniref:Plasmid mobilization system relaxase n=1 Tax=Ancylobacter aquaticus TaxID=100 RepID=A0A4R1HJC5_ANCAQ|nr:Ti-type conjugative transfer relaxase TraA [Ancylobacter aquaticus]TCK19619.1 plasmid mobilization system relaxase [Ancylobacter aquaticus]